MRQKPSLIVAKRVCALDAADRSFPLIFTDVNNNWKMNGIYDKVTAEENMRGNNDNENFANLFKAENVVEQKGGKKWW